MASRTQDGEGAFTPGGPRLARYAIIAGLFISAVAAPAPQRAQKATDGPGLCPSIALCCRPLTPGRPAPFEATLHGGSKGVEPTYRWTVSGGDVVGGQGTSSALIDPKDFKGRTILTTLEVGGYGRRCSATCLAEVSARPTRQTLALDVSVRNAHNGRPVPRARVSFRPAAGAAADDRAEADEGGRVSRAGLEPGTYRFVAEAGGFDRQETTLTLDQFSSGSLVISLLPRAAPPPPTPTPTPDPSPSPTPSPNATPNATPAATPEPAPTPSDDTPPQGWFEGWSLAQLALGLAILAALGAVGHTVLTSGGAGLTAAAAGATGKAGDDVHCTVFAPEQAAPGDYFIVQVFAHLAAEAERLAGLAARAGDHQREQISKWLSSPVKQGTVLTFKLEMPGLVIAEPEQTLVWRGAADCVQFAVDVPRDFEPDEIRCHVRIYSGPARVETVMFMFRVAEAGAAGSARGLAAVTQEQIRHRHAFISYCSKDRREVLPRVQGLERGLKLEGITCFMDKHDIKPGEQWREVIRRHLDQCDVFYLFWSSNAKDSKEVRYEVEYALARKGRDERKPPFFEPFTIELPLPTPLPDGLESLHFDDRLLYEIKAVEAMEAESSGGPLRGLFKKVSGLFR